MIKNFLPFVICSQKIYVMQFSENYYIICDSFVHRTLMLSININACHYVECKIILCKNMRSMCVSSLYCHCPCCHRNKKYIVHIYPTNQYRIILWTIFIYAKLIAYNIIKLFTILSIIS